MDKNPDRESIMKSWMSYTIEDTTIIENYESLHALTPNKFLPKKAVQMLYMTSQDLLQSQSSEMIQCGHDKKSLIYFPIY